MEIPEPPFERLPKHFLLQGSPALESLSFPETENILKAREIVARENSSRGWEDDDCYSEVEGDEEDDDRK